jgi:transcriptional regulator with XRE-family HTH domain
MSDQFPKGRTQAKPGTVLKELRGKRGWTLSDVAQRTGLPISTLSKIENEKIALTLEKLIKISDGLGIDITELFGATADSAAAEGGNRRSIALAGEGRAIETPKGNYLYTASELLNKRMIPIIGEVLVKDIADYGEFQSHPGEEYVYVLDGTLELHTSAYTPARLQRGDSVYFDASMPHAYIAVGDEICRILSVCATSEAHLMEVIEGVAPGDEARPLRRITRA